MASHRRDDPEDEPVALRRLARALGVDHGWTPTQPQPVDPVTADEPRRPVRIAAHPSALTWLLLSGLAVLLVSGYLLSHHRGATSAAAPGPTPLPATPASAAAATIVVDVGGRVRHPGLVTLPVGSRVADAIAAAGGALRPADIATLDLAAHVTDGQLLLIGVPGAAGAAATTGAGGGPLDLNSATVEQLDALPGVGPVLAARIVAWREAHGGFRSVDDLQQVPGIGPRKFSDLKALVSA
jgi:competence protein ComEA